VRDTLRQVGFSVVALLGGFSGACAGAHSVERPAVPATQLALHGECEAFQIEADPDVTAGKRLSAPQPSAPRSGAAEGVACAHVTINTEGKVVEAEVVYSTSQEFGRNFKRALARWRYEPATRDGAPVEVRAMMSATYSVRQVLPPQ